MLRGKLIMRRVSESMRGRLKTGLIFMSALYLTACGVSNVVIEGRFPTPNIDKLPLTVAVYYEPSLREYAYIEYSETGSKEYNIASGQSHIELFGAVLPAMFDEVLVVDSIEEGKALGVDAIFVPNIDEFQLALPAKTKLGVFEVWIKYNMRLIGGEGDYIADWVLKAYGKTPIESLRSVEAAINAAAVVALRDLASSFTLSFTEVPEIDEWLHNTL